MDRNDIIMSILEEKGLDKRFRENPEAIRQICSLVLDEIKKAARKEISARDEFEKYASYILDREEVYIGKDGERGATTFSIGEDGSLDVKLKTEVTSNDMERRRADEQKVFSIGEKRGDLVVSERSEYLSKISGHTFADVSLGFSTFNKHGLEMTRRQLSQNIQRDTTERINNCREAFYFGSKPDYELSPVEEYSLERGKELVTQNYKKTRCNNCKILAFEMGAIMKKHKKEDNVVNPAPLVYELGGKLPEIVQVGQVPNYLPEYNTNYLYGCTDALADFYATKTKAEMETDIQAQYPVAAKYSTAFKRTLIEEAKTNPDLQKVVEQLDLVITTTKEEEKLMRTFGIVTVSDLQRAYENVSAPEIKSVMQTLLETSRTEDRGKDTEDITKG